MKSTPKRQNVNFYKVLQKNLWTDNPTYTHLVLSSLPLLCIVCDLKFICLIQSVVYYSSPSNLRVTCGCVQ